MKRSRPVHRSGSPAAALLAASLSLGLLAYLFGPPQLQLAFLALGEWLAPLWESWPVRTWARLFDFLVADVSLDLLALLRVEGPLDEREAWALAMGAVPTIMGLVFLWREARWRQMVLQSDLGLVGILASLRAGVRPPSEANQTARRFLAERGVEVEPEPVPRTRPQESDFAET